MRVAIVGASGNVGTGILRALAQAPEISHVRGFARRLPDRTQEPYRHAEWFTIDVGADVRGSAADELKQQLIGSFIGMDVVIHLAWLIQPNHDRELLRRTNVTGTRRVAQAAAQAGAKHLIVATSWAAYSPVDDDVPRPETAPTLGIPRSHYSADKAAQEAVLDEIQAQYPNLVITRMRQALVFSADAGAQIDRYFLGPLIPVSVLRPGRLPLVPLPRGLRLQVVHTDDLGRAYREIIQHRAGGAYNIAADDVLWPQAIARILGRGRFVEISPALIRPVLALAWRLRLVAADPGWLDMGMNVPVMDSTKIRRATQWRPQHCAAATLREMLVGMADRRGLASVPMRPSYRAHEGHPGEVPISVSDGRGVVPPTIDLALLGLYLSDHLTGATAGRARIQRMARAYRDTFMGPELAAIAEEISSEHQFLGSVIDELGLRRRPYRQAVAGVGELLGRLKLNQRVTHTSPMTVVLELELMRSAVMGKLGVWQSLQDLAGVLGRDPGQFAQLAERARDQAARLERLHATVREPAFHQGLAHR